MRVLCINTLGNIPFEGIEIKSPLMFLMEYTVTTIEHGPAGKIFYVLDEIGPGVSFIDSAFIPLSTFDETLLINHPIKKRK